MKETRVADTHIHSVELVLPNDTNTLGNLMGGKLLHWMDIVSAISAQRASRRTVVTVAVDFVEFKTAIPLGAVVLLNAKVTRAFTSSMEVRVDVGFQVLGHDQIEPSNSAYYTFVAVDQSGRPIPVNQVRPETEDEKELYESALQRRELRLMLAGRVNPQDSTVLKQLFKL